jgi:hypothetical protein
MVARVAAADRGTAADRNGLPYQGLYTLRVLSIPPPYAIRKLHTKFTDGESFSGPKVPRKCLALVINCAFNQICFVLI